MKKTLMIILLAAGMAGNAQVYKDLAVTWWSPDSGAVMTSNSDFSMTASVKNVGSNNVAEDDIIYCGLVIPGLNSNQPLPATFDIISHGEMEPGDSVTYSKDYVLVFGPDEVAKQEAEGGFVCFGVVFQDADGNPLDTAFGNDFSCQYIKMEAPGSTGAAELIKAKGIEVFPQPAGELVNIRMRQPEEATATLFDVSGKELGAYSFVSGTASINLKGMENGVYVYRILSASGEKIRSGTIIVKR